MGVCAKCSTWRVLPCGPDGTYHPHTQGLHIKLVLMIQPFEYHNASQILLYYKLHWSIIPSVNECELYKPIISHTL